MEKSRKIKILSIVALVLAITGMSLGFAAFSSTLNISSSATVTPNAENFKIKIYGFTSEEAIYTFINTGELSEDSISDVHSVAMTSGEVSSAENAIINNDNLSISNINGTFISDQSSISYVFLIINEGAYDAYFNIKDYLGSFGTINYNYKPTCIPGEGATPELVEAACSSFEEGFHFMDLSMNPLDKENNYYFLKKEDALFMFVVIDYLRNFADGPFDVQFKDLQLEFTTNPQ